jgi:hypothetical protein
MRLPAVKFKKGPVDLLHFSDNDGSGTSLGERFVVRQPSLAYSKESDQLITIFKKIPFCQKHGRDPASLLTVRKDFLIPVEVVI